MFILLTKNDNRTLNVHLKRLVETGHDVFLPLTYEALTCIPSTPMLPVIFTEPERLTDREAAAAQKLSDAAMRGPVGCVTLNSPGWTMGRFELLRRLFASGRNGFNVYRVTEVPEAVRYPVFVRHADRHAPVCTPLLHDRTALDRAIAALVAAGSRREGLLVIEFLDYALDGEYVKYCAYRIGDQIVPAMRMTSREWEIRDLDPAKRSVEDAAREAAYIAENPHREVLMEISDLAHISYGRIDYALVDGRVQVFEINTNPSCAPTHVRDAFFAALAPFQDGDPRRRRRFQSGGRRYAAFKLHETAFFALSLLVILLPPSLGSPAGRLLFTIERRTKLFAWSVAKRLKSLRRSRPAI